MTPNEILRKLSDLVSSAEQIKNDVEQSAAPADELPVNIQQPEDSAELMIPPLQLKLELLKKAVGVDSVYDDDHNVENHHETDILPPTSNVATVDNEVNVEAPTDELEILKKNAGLTFSIIDTHIED